MMGLIFQDKPIAVPHWFNDATELQRADGRTSQQRGEEKVVTRADDDGVETILVHLLEDAVAAPASPQNHQSLSPPVPRPQQR